MFYDATRNQHGFPNDPFKALVAPRPVGWISTLSPAGNANLAPYSFFNAFSENPHYVAFGSTTYKDTLRNVEAAREFAVNLVSHEMREEMNQSSANVPAHVDEFEYAGIEKAPCQLIKSPRVAKSPATFECKLHHIVELPNDEGKVANWLVVGRVIGIHVDDRFIKEGRVNSAAMHLIARLGYSEYATVTEAWRMRRPD